MMELLEVCCWICLKMMWRCLFFCWAFLHLNVDISSFQTFEEVSNFSLSVEITETKYWNQNSIYSPTRLFAVKKLDIDFITRFKNNWKELTFYHDAWIVSDSNPNL